MEKENKKQDRLYKNTQYSLWKKYKNIVKIELSIDISNVLNYTFSKKSRRRETCMTIKDIAKNLNVSYSTVPVFVLE